MRPSGSLDVYSSETVRFAKEILYRQVYASFQHESPPRLQLGDGLQERYVGERLSSH